MPAIPASDNRPMTSAPASCLAAGQVIGRYELLERIGGGGFGEVWRARRIEVAGEAPGGTCPATFALKFATRPDAVAALKREGAIQSRLDHPGIVRIVDQDLAHDPPYVVMEYCPGGNLRGFVGRLDADAPRTPLDVREVLRKIAVALGYAHVEGVVHGDLKPENIVFDLEGNPKITDFGLGTTVSGAEVALSRSLASVELGGGTLAYLAPERHSGAPPTRAGDVWSFGIMLFEATFRRLPMGIEWTEWPLGPIFARCYAPVSRRLPTANAIVSAFAKKEAPATGLEGAAATRVQPRSTPPTAKAAPQLNFHRRRDLLMLGLVAFTLMMALFYFGTDVDGRARGRQLALQAIALAEQLAPPPPEADLISLRSICQLAHEKLAQIGPAGPTGRDEPLIRVIDAQLDAARRMDYLLRFDLKTATVLALPRHRGWPAFIYDPSGWRKQ